MNHYLNLKPKAVLCSLLAALSLNVYAEEPKSIFPNSGEMSLSGVELVQQLVKSNSQILFSDLQRQIAQQRVAFEQGVYESEVFSQLRYDDTYKQTTASERLSSISRLDEDVYDDQTASFEVGVRSTVATGAEIAISYLGTQQTNNVIPLTDEGEDKEVTESLNLTIKQPLLKGFKNRQVETRIKKAQLEEFVVGEEFEQQLLKMTYEALNLYWYLYKVEEIYEIKQKTLTNAEDSLKDISLRVESGKLPHTAIYEAKSNLLKRRADLKIAKLAVNEAQSKLKTLLNLSNTEYQNLTFEVIDQPDTNKVYFNKPFQDYFTQVLETWPNYQIALKKIEIYDQDIVAAQDESKPSLNLDIGYSTNSLEYSWKPSNTLKTDYPTWYAGLSFNMYLQGNERAKAKESLAKVKRLQGQVDLGAVKAGLANDLKLKIFQVNNAYDELLALEENVEVLSELLAAEKEQFQFGKLRLIDLYQREDSLNQAKQRYLDGVVKYQLAKAALNLADGSLLEKYKVNVSTAVDVSQ